MFIKCYSRYATLRAEQQKDNSDITVLGNNSEKIAQEFDEKFCATRRGPKEYASRVYI